MRDGAGVEPDGAPDAARVVLAERLRTAWEASESKLPLDRLGAKLKERLRGQDIKGLGRSSVGRYMDRGHTTLPDKAVLTALAEIFGVGDEELALWHRLQSEARAAQRRRRLQRPAAADRNQDTPDTGSPAEARAGDPPTSATDTGPAPDAAPDAVRVSWWSRVPAAARIGSAALVLVLAAGGALGLVLWRDQARDEAAVVSAAAATGPGPGPLPAAGVTPTPSGVEKGSLGEDSRCGALLKGPRAVVWRVCARVEPDRVSFALKIINGGQAAARVKMRLEYAQATEFHPCPKTSGTQVLSIPAGQTVLTDPGRCAVPREDVPFAYQGVGWVLAEDADAGSYELSPTAHVYPHRVIWKPDLV
ncbi:hypothetical protein ABZ924_13225 [Streptomyces sp. NPDC046876]|uniref:hypothetical protein n=1 Tax=Streptomyces sp. NPDC046876 TaxID=3155616 RepID=UPI003402D845